MDEATLRQLIAGGETATVEFKSSAARPIDVAERMCGIANNRAGGIIIFAQAMKHECARDHPNAPADQRALFPVSGVDVLRVRNGKVAEKLAYVKG